MSNERPKRMSDEEFWRVSAACDCGCPANIRTGEEAERARASEMRMAHLLSRANAAISLNSEPDEFEELRESIRSALSEVES